MNRHFTIATLTGSMAALTVWAVVQAQNPAQIDLDGVWVDGGKDVQIVQLGSSVKALWLPPYPICRYAGGRTYTTTVDFTATLSGNTLKGLGSTCDHDSGHKDDPIELTVSADGQTLTGIQLARGGTKRLPATLTRKCVCNEVNLGMSLDRAIEIVNGMTTGSAAESNIASGQPGLSSALRNMRGAVCAKTAVAKVDAAANIARSLSSGDPSGTQQTKLDRMKATLQSIREQSCGSGPTAGGPGRIRCPDVSTIERMKAKADEVVSIAQGGAQIAKYAGDAETQKVFEDTAEAVGHLPDALEKVINLVKKCELLRSLLDAVDEINKAGCDSGKLARGFDNLFRTAGELGKSLTVDPITTMYFDMLSRNQSFFVNVSGELNPEQRWKKQFGGIDKYVPGGCR